MKRLRQTVPFSTGHRKTRELTYTSNGNATVFLSISEEVFHDMHMYRLLQNKLQRDRHYGNEQVRGKENENTNDLS